MTLLKPLLLVAALLLPAAATAAPISIYTGSGSVLIDEPFADFFDTDGDATDISVTIEASDDGLFGALLVSDATGTLLESDSLIGELIEPFGVPDSIGLLFNAIRGSQASRFTGFVAVVFDYSRALQDDGVFEPVDVTLYAAPVPVPASLGLLLLGLGAIGGLARRRA